MPASEVDVGGRQILQALVVALMIVVFDEAIDVRFKIAGQVVVVEQNAVLERLVPASETSIGGSELGEETDDREHRQKYCVTDSFDRQIGRLKNKRIDVRPFWLTYVLKTGSNWSGPIRQFRLVIERDHPSTFVSFCGQNVRRLNAMQSELRSRNYYPMKDLHILFLKTGSR